MNVEQLRLEREFEGKRAALYGDASLNWEKKMLTLRRLRTEYDRKIRAAETAQAEEKESA